MPYTVFALKWRPKTFEEVIGQEHIVSTLKNAIQKSRTAHAYLFAGPRGVGKTSTARILAKALNCKNGPTATPCLKCPACLEINDGRSLDCIEIDGASNRGIDEIRVLRENVKFSPSAGKFKIYIIDEVHMLTTEAFNALLKTLEEPPEFVKFIFATTQPHKILSTILSRCQRFDFRRITAMEISRQLTRIIQQEKLEIDKEVIFTIAKASDGSLRDAESLLDQLVSFSREKISLKDVVNVLGLIEQEALFELTEKIIHKDPTGALILLNRVIDEGKDTAVFLPELIEHFRNLMVAKVSKGDSKLIDLPEEACQRLLKQSEAFRLDEIFIAFNVLVNTYEMSKRLSSQRIPLEITLIKLAHNKKELDYGQKPDGEKPAEQVKLKEAAVKDNVIKEEKAPEQPPQIMIAMENVKTAWKNIIDNLGRIKISVATYLNEGIPLKIHGNVLTIAFPKNYSLHKESLESRTNLEIIEKNISEILKANIRVKFLLSEEVKQEENAKDDAFIKSTLEMFDGRLIREG